MRAPRVVVGLVCVATSSCADVPDSLPLAVAGQSSGGAWQSSTGATQTFAGAGSSMTDAGGSSGAGSRASGDVGGVDGLGVLGGTAGAVAVSGGSGPTFPSVEASLVLRLEHDFGVELSADKLSAWRDRSAKHNDAVQGDAKFQPSIEDLDGLKLPAFSGKSNPKSTDGSGGPYLRIKDSASLHWGTGDFAVLLVVAYDNALDGTHNGGFGTFFGKFGKPELLFTGNWTWSETEERSKLHIGFGEGAPGFETNKEGFNDGKLRLVAAVRLGNRASVRVNAVDLGGVNGVARQDVSAVDVDAAIGSFSGKQALRCLRGQVAAVFALAGPKTSSDLPLVETYLLAKYPVAPLP
jgi:hypothetical protein